MTPNGFVEILHHLQTTGFREIAGARISADLPLSERLINELVAASLPPNVAVREVSIRPEAGNQFSVRLTPRTSLLPPITLKLEIEQQPEFPRSPVLTLRMKTMGGLFGFASAALPIGNMLPPGVRLEAGRIMIDLRAMAAHQGAGALIQHVTQLTVASESGRVVVHLEAGA